ADPDPFRNRLRQALGRWTPGLLEELAAADQVEGLPPSSVVLLATALKATKHEETAVEVLRKARRLHPDDLWINYTLAILLSDAKPDEAVRFFTAALAVRPQSLGTRCNLGIALHKKGSLAEAAAEFREAIRLKPDFALAHDGLGTALRKQGKVAEA